MKRRETIQGLLPVIVCFITGACILIAVSTTQCDPYDESDATAYVAVKRTGLLRQQLTFVAANSGPLITEMLPGALGHVTASISLILLEMSIEVFESDKVIGVWIDTVEREMPEWD